MNLILPVFLLLLIFLFFLHFARTFRDGNPNGFVPDRKMHRTDGKLLLGICLLYGAVAFFRLGSADAPQTVMHFSEYGSCAAFTVDAGYGLSGVRYYTGLNPGTYYLYVSTDGAQFSEPVELEQTYDKLFRWCDSPALDFAGDTPLVIQILSDREMYLGEVVFYDRGGSPIPASAIHTSGDAQLLLDEQETEDEGYTFYTGSYFDEIYHARTALEHLWKLEPYETTHPPLGKLLISLGIVLFGMTPFGWRFMGTLFGVLMLPVLYALVKRLFGSRAIAAAGTVIFAFDFMHFTQTRIATIDTYGVFFTLLMYLFMYRFLSEPAEMHLKGQRRRSLLLCGICFGLGCASKWTCLYAGAGLALLWAIYQVQFCRGTLTFADGSPDSSDRPAWKAGASGQTRKDRFPGVLENAAWCIVFFILIPAVIYYVSYIPYGQARGLKGVGMLFTREYAEIVVNNQVSMFRYHSLLVAEHPYSSVWSQWLLDIRPILYYLQYYDDGTRASLGCFTSPLLCWAGLIAMCMMPAFAIVEKDRRAGFICLGYLAQLLPWVFITRLTFAYHYFPCTVFLTLGICYLFSVLRRCDRHWKRSIGAFVCVSLALFLLFYPVLSGLAVDGNTCGALLKWLDTWPF